MTWIGCCRIACHFIKTVLAAQYDAQLEQKVQFVRGLFKDVANIPELQIIPSPRKQNFRDRANVVLWSDIAPGGTFMHCIYTLLCTEL